MPHFSFGSSNISGTIVSYVEAICGCSSSGEDSVIVLVGEGDGPMTVGRWSRFASFVPVDCSTVGHRCGHRVGARRKLEQLTNMYDDLVFACSSRDWLLASFSD